MSDYNNSHFKALLKHPIVKLVDLLVETVIKKSPIKKSEYARNKKYTIRDYAIGIIDAMKNNSSWNSYNGVINGNTLRKKHNEWVKLNIYDEVYKTSLNKYFKQVPKTEELKYQSIDSTFIKDVNGSKKSKFNAVYKGKKGSSLKGIKVTSIVTTKGIPISLNVDSGNRYDSVLLPKAINNIAVDCHTKKYHNHNRYKQYFIGDPGYDSKKNIKLLKRKGYVPIIKQNRRNTKKKHLLQKFTKKQYQTYKKRIIVENYHSWLKKFTKVKTLNEKKTNYYRGLLLLAASTIIHRRIY
jgi:hypothetical protein